MPGQGSDSEEICGDLLLTWQGHKESVILLVVGIINLV